MHCTNLHRQPGCLADGRKPRLDDHFLLNNYIFHMFHDKQVDSLNWNKIWRYLHLTLGLILVTYHARIAWYHNGFVDSVWSAGVDKFVSTTLIFFVMWTGLAKWPIYPAYKKRKNRKRREKKAEASATE